MRNRNVRIFNRIAFKVGFIIILVEVIILAVVGIYYVTHFSSQLEKHAEIQIQTPASLINQGVMTYDVIGDRESVSKIVGGELKEGVLFGLNKRIFYASNNDHIGKAIDKVTSITFEKKFFDLTIKEPKTRYEINQNGKFLHCIAPLFAVDGKTPRFFLILRSAQR